MSASAFCVTHDKIYACSDGLTVDLEKLEPIGRNSRKVFKMSDHTLVTTGGCKLVDQGGRSLCEIVQDHAKKNALKYPEQIADVIRSLLNVSPADHPYFDMINYTVLGYNEAGEIQRIHFTKDSEQGTSKPISPGNVGVMAHECDYKAKEHFVKVLQRNQQAGLPIPEAIRKAWKETVNHYSEQGYLFGGNLFMESVHKPIHKLNPLYEN